MYVQMNITREGSSFVTTQSLKQDAYTALSTLAGCIGAFFRLCAAFMNGIENSFYATEAEDEDLITALGDEEAENMLWIVACLTCHWCARKSEAPKKSGKKV